jgi:hypothetical protein
LTTTASRTTLYASATTTPTTTRQGGRLHKKRSTTMGPYRKDPVPAPLTEVATPRASPIRAAPWTARWPRGVSFLRTSSVNNVAVAEIDPIDTHAVIMLMRVAPSTPNRYTGPSLGPPTQRHLDPSPSTLPPLYRPRRCLSTARTRSYPCCKGGIVPGDSRGNYAGHHQGPALRSSGPFRGAIGRRPLVPAHRRSVGHFPRRCARGIVGQVHGRSCFLRRYLTSDRLLLG